MKSAINRRALLIGGTAAAVWQHPMVETRAQTDDKTSFMRSSIADINAQNARKSSSQSKTWAGTLPEIKPFGDWDYYYLGDKLNWTPNEGQHLHTVTVPKGFVTDLASIPQAFWSLLPKTGRYAYAAVVHDYLYWAQPSQITRGDADEILETAMSDSSVSRATIRIISAAVTLSGQSAWDNNKSLKKTGERRFLKVFPDNPLVSWSDWKRDPGHLTDEPT